MLRDTLTPSGISGSSGTSGTSGTSSISPAIYVDSTSGDVYFYDDTRSKNLGVAIIQTDAGRNNDIVTNVYLRSSGDTPTNLNGFVLPWNATLIAISMSGRSNSQVWSAQVRSNGGTTPLDFLTIVNQYSKHDNSKNTDFMAGDRIQIFCSGVNIEYPNVTLFFRRRF
jgi:hypothetical protein